MLLRTRSEIRIHLQVLCEPLGKVAITKRRSVEVRLQEAYDVQLEILEHATHASRAIAHVLVKAKVHGPYTGCDYAVGRVVRLDRTCIHAAPIWYERCHEDEQSK